MKGNIIKYKALKKNLRKIPNYNNKNFISKKGTDKKNIMDDFLKIIGIIGVFIAALFILPWLYFWFAYFGGWITKITIGKYLIEGLSFLGISIPLNKIPLLAGVLGWLGGFFKSYYTNYKKN